jgi:hypothetical protein
VDVVKDGEIDMLQSGALEVGTLELSAVVRRLVDEQLPGIPGRPHALVESAIRRGIARKASVGSILVTGLMSAGRSGAKAVKRSDWRRDS